MRNARVRIFSQGTPAKVQSNRNFRFTLRGPYWLSDPLIAYHILLDTSMEDYGVEPSTLFITIIFNLL